MLLILRIIYVLLCFEPHFILAEFVFSVTSHSYPPIIAAVLFYSSSLIYCIYYRLDFIYMQLKQI